MFILLPLSENQTENITEEQEESSNQQETPLKMQQAEFNILKGRLQQAKIHFCEGKLKFDIVLQHFVPLPLNIFELYIYIYIQ